MNSPSRGSPILPPLADIENMVRVLKLYGNGCRYDRSPMRSLLIGWHQRGEHCLQSIASRWDIPMSMLERWLQLFQVEIEERIERAARESRGHPVPRPPRDDDHVTLRSSQIQLVIKKISHRYIQTGSWGIVAGELHATLEELRVWARQHLASMGSFGLNSVQLKILLE